MNMTTNSVPIPAAHRKRIFELVAIFRMNKLGIAMAGFVMMSFLSTSSRAFVSKTTPLRRRTFRAMTSQINDEQLVQDMLYRIRQINQMPADVRSSLLEFQVDGITLGKVRSNLLMP
jgi:hypothetical protein